MVDSGKVAMTDVLHIYRTLGSSLFLYVRSHMILLRHRTSSSGGIHMRCPSRMTVGGLVFQQRTYPFGNVGPLLSLLLTTMN